MYGVWWCMVCCSVLQCVSYGVTWSVHHAPVSVAGRVYSLSHSTIHHSLCMVRQRLCDVESTPYTTLCRTSPYTTLCVWWSVCMVESTPYTSLCHTIHESLSHHPLVSVTRSHQPFCASEPTARLSCDTIHSKIQ